MTYNALVISGGAIRGFGLLGAIQYIQDREWLKEIHKFVGTSIGAIIGYLLCIGYSPTEIMVNLCQKGLFDKLSKMDVMNVINGMGAVSFSVIQDHLEKMTIHKVKKYVTFGELYRKYGKELVCCTYNSTLEQAEYISYKNHPDMNCITALRMSASLPFLFDPFIYGNSVYMDGGLVNNFPIDRISHEDRAICIRIGKNDIHKEKEEEDNLMIRFYKTILIPIQNVENFMIEKMSGHQIDVVSVSIPTSMTIHFTLSNTDKFDMFSIGYDTMRRYFESKDA